ncbi:MAG: class I SAM-dependent methyltransferase [Sulfuritalea sp.]|nr:class I SAM-dependent methyltransferase [Sulfuritalea sp.]
MTRIDRALNGAAVSDGTSPGDRHPLVPALLAQVLAALIAGGLALLLVPVMFSQPLLLATLQGVLALLIAWRLGAPIWWLPIHLCFLPLAVMARGMALPGWVWGGGFMLLLLVFWRTDKSRVPLYLTNRRSRDALQLQLPAGPCRVIDLGCGDGAVLRQLAAARPDCRFVGIEHAPLTWAWAWLRARGQCNLSIRCGDFWTHSLAGYDLVYAFLSPAAMPTLGIKARTEMSPCARLVSNSFPIPGQVALDVIDVADARKTRFYTYDCGRSL